MGAVVKRNGYVKHMPDQSGHPRDIREYVKPARDWYNPMSAVPNPPKYPNDLALGRLYLSPGQRIEWVESVRAHKQDRGITKNSMPIRFG